MKTTITAMRADIIHVMENGAVIESGTHHELLRKVGTYRNLYDGQFKAVLDTRPLGTSVA